MTKAPAFQWYPKDCDTDENVRAMDDAEFGFYVRCLNHSWLNDGLPADIAEFARIMGKTPKQLLKLWARVSRCFFENSEKRFVNFRQEQQRAEQENFRKKRVEAANSKWANKETMQVHLKTDAKPMQVQCSASASASATANQVQTPDTPQAAKPIEISKRGTRFKLMELPEDWAKWAMKKRGWSTAQTQEVYEAFCDHWISKSGADATKLDWLAAWRFWCRNQRAPPGQNTGLFQPQPDRNETRRNETIAMTTMLRGMQP